MMKQRHMTASIKYYTSEGDTPDVVISQAVWYSDDELAYETLAERCANEIAATRNIAATWDIVRVRLDDEDITEAVKEAYDRLWAVRRPQFVKFV